MSRNRTRVFISVFAFLLSSQVSADKEFFTAYAGEEVSPGIFFLGEGAGGGVFRIRHSDGSYIVRKKYKSGTPQHRNLDLIGLKILNLFVSKDENGFNVVKVIDEKGDDEIILENVFGRSLEELLHKGFLNETQKNILLVNYYDYLDRFCQELNKSLGGEEGIFSIGLSGYKVWLKYGEFEGQPYRILLRPANIVVDPKNLANLTIIDPQ